MNTNARNDAAAGGSEAGDMAAGFAAPAAGRLDKIVAEAFPEVSRSRLQQVIKAGGVMVDGRAETAPSAKVAAGSAIVVTLPEPEPARPPATAIDLDILYEDDALIVINKPAGMVVHPAAGHHDDTLVNALLAHCGDSLSGVGGVRRPGIVHRLDKDTSGVMVAAKTDRAHQGLSAQFADHGRSGPLQRSYTALVWGEPPARLRIDKPLARSIHNREKIVVTTGGREAITHVTRIAGWLAPVVRQGAPAEPLVSQVRCELETGRTHQIRVHMAASGHPLLGDRLYGSGYMTRASRLGAAAGAALARLGRQALHAQTLGFAHPLSGETMSFSAPPPPDLADLIEALGRDVA